ncbi:MAG TPA: hypothetical protein P5267_03610 [Patescibacteria group bacterium]|nr:hypothetical protein [Patescibacteria group bacterium]
MKRETNTFDLRECRVRPHIVALTIFLAVAIVCLYLAQLQHNWVLAAVGLFFVAIFIWLSGWIIQSRRRVRKWLCDMSSFASLPASGVAVKIYFLREGKPDYSVYAGDQVLMIAKKILRDQSIDYLIINPKQYLQDQVAWIKDRQKDLADKLRALEVFEHLSV